MQGVFLVAAEGAKRGFIVCVTSRNAIGADLLATDGACKKTWSVQVKTNTKRASFWLTGKHARTATSDTHAYVFVTLNGKNGPEFHAVPSKYIASHTYDKNGAWHSFERSELPPGSDDWSAFASTTDPE